MTQHGAGAEPPAALGALPAEMSSFVGRERLLEQARGLLGRSRLVTLTGTGGVGKTRLALRLARLVADDYPDGVVLVELAEVPADRDRLAGELLTALGISDAAETDQVARLTDVLLERHVLLVLDNAEHLLSPDGRGPLTDLLRTLLRGVPHLAVLVTSRSRLGVVGEHLLLVPPLNRVGEDGETAEATRLLADRARAVGRELGPADADAAARLCELLDGLPLAIELAAGWLDAMTLDEVVAGLADPLNLLVDNEPTEQAHHRSLRAMLDWSYRLLAPGDQLMWAVLSEFAGGFRARSVAEVCRTLGMPGDVRESLARLVHNSVLARRDTASGETRYRLLEPVRHYGLHLTPDGLDRRAVREAHAAHYAALTRQAAAEWFGPDEVAWMHRLLDDAGNINASVEWLIGVGRVTDALTMTVDLSRCRAYTFGGRINSTRRLLGAGLAAHPDEPSPVQVAALAGSAWSALIQGKPESARPLLRRCHDLLARLGIDPPPMVRFVEGTYLCLVEADPERARRSVAILDEAALAVDNPGDAEMINLFACFAETFHGDPYLAVRRTTARAENSERVGAAWAASWMTWAQALALLQRGDASAASERLQRALTTQHSMGDLWGLSWSLWLAAVLAAERGEHVTAARLLGRARNRQRQTEVSLLGLRPFLLVQQRAERAARLALGDERFDAEVGVGEAMSHDEEIALARAVPGDPAPKSVPGGLTNRERQVVALMAEGMANKDVAERLRLSVRTVETHLSNAMAKVGVSGRVQLAAWYLRSTRG